jgi:hypothetical protein
MTTKTPILPASYHGISPLLARTLDQLAHATGHINHAGDELLVRYLIETGEIDPDSAKGAIDQAAG